MTTIKIVNKNNSIQFIQVLTTQEYIDLKERIIKENIFFCPDNLLIDYISDYDQDEIEKIKRLSSELSTKILYDAMMKEENDDAFLDEIISNGILDDIGDFHPILELQEIMDNSPILNFLIANYDIYMTK